MKKTLYLVLTVVVLLTLAIGVGAAKNKPNGKPFNALWQAIEEINGGSSCDCELDCEECWQEDRIADIEEDIAELREEIEDLKEENDKLQEAVEYLQERLLDEKELACINSGGTVTTSSCCSATEDFPNLCVTGACGCSPENSHEVKVCNCGEGKCFNGTECVSL